MLVVDASVAVKWSVREPETNAATALLSESMIAPDLFLAELGSALTKKVRRGEIAVDQAWLALAEGRERVQLFTSTDLVSPAFELSLTLRHAIYDCYYLALAEALNTPLVTSDRIFVLKVRSTELRSRIHLLGEDISQ